MSKIEWCDITWNPVTGCTKISEGCRNCYAERMAKRLKGRFGYPEDDPFQVILHDDRLSNPLKWKTHRRVFVCSMGDLFHDDVPDEYIQDVFEVMISNPQHTYMILTKRPQRMAEFLTEKKIALSLADRPHIWLGVTAENQKTADERIPILLQIPAIVRFVSVEPMLGYVDLLEKGYLADHEWEFGVPGGLNWVICGGESGHNARPTHPDWVRSLRDQCVGAGVPFFFKGWGEWGVQDPALIGKKRGEYKYLEDIGDGSPCMFKIGKKAAGRELDGREWNEFPKAC